MTHSLIIHTLKQARRLVIIVVGFTVLLIGLALLVLPGPAFVVIPVGLAILATEFVWARKLLARVKREATRAVSAVTGRPPRRSSDKSG
jgi:tellurite resistance protein TerC